MHFLWHFPYWILVLLMTNRNNCVSWDQPWDMAYHVCQMPSLKQNEFHMQLQKLGISQMIEELLCSKAASWGTIWLRKSSEVRFSLNKMHPISLCGNPAVWGTLPYRIRLVFLASGDETGCKTEILFVLKWYESCFQCFVRDNALQF